MPEVRQAGPLLATGNTAEVYAWQEGTILKLFLPRYSEQDVAREFSVTNAAHACADGLLVPRPIRMQTIGQRNGIVYERADGISMLQRLMSNPWQTFACARTLADLHLRIHACEASAALPEQRRRLTSRLNQARELPAILRERLLAQLEAMPPQNGLCHGDFHPGNILTNGSFHTIIDWNDATRGDPLADLARTGVLLEAVEATGHLPGCMANLALRVLRRVYLRRYLARTRARKADYQRWRLIIIAARLAENIPGERKWLLQQLGVTPAPAAGKTDG